MNRSRASVSCIFLLHGLTVSTWVCRIPAAQTELGLSPGTLGLVLLATSAGSLLSMPLTGWLVAHYGSRRIVPVASCLFSLALVPLARAGSAWQLAGALFLFGAAAGAQNVSMNAHAVAVEEALRRPVMGSFHALFSLGAMVGAALGGLVAEHGISVAIHFAAAALVYVTATVLVSTGLHGQAQRARSPKLTLRFPRAVGALGLLAFAILIVEGSIADWSAVYLKSVLRTDSGESALGYAAYSAAMVVGRFAGDHLTAAWGRVPLVRLGACVAAVGLAISVVSGAPVPAIAGFGVVGLGLSVITPNVFGAAGRVRELPPGVGLAAVTTAGYIGFLSGPPAIGGVAQLLGLRTALSMMIGAVLCAAALSGAVGQSE